MPRAPDRIAALLARDIATITRALRDGGTVAQWERAMQDAIARGHVAAAIAGEAERGIIGRGRAALATWLGARVLPAAVRQAITDAVARQLSYLRQFAADIATGRLSDAQIAARAGLYAGAVRATWGAARHAGAGLPAMPGDGSSECLTQCGCAWVERPNGYYWERGKDASCPTCLSREAQWAPWIA
jgi:hypothetical protein